MHNNPKQLYLIALHPFQIENKHYHIIAYEYIVDNNEFHIVGKGKETTHVVRE